MTAATLDRATVTVPALRRNLDRTWPDGSLALAGPEYWQPVELVLDLAAPEHLAAEVAALIAEKQTQGFSDFYTAVRLHNPDPRRDSLRIDIRLSRHGGWLPPTATAPRQFFDRDGRHIHRANSGDPDVAYAVDPLTLPADWHLTRWAIDQATADRAEQDRQAAHKARHEANLRRRVDTLQGFTPTLRERQLAAWILDLQQTGGRP